MQVEKVLREVKRALEAAGFTVTEDVVRGFSGYHHRFDFAAEREGCRLYVLVAANALALLMEFAKSFDVGGEILVAASGFPPPPLPERGNFKLVSAASVEELKGRLLEALARQKE